MRSFIIHTKECPIPDDKKSWAYQTWNFSIVAASGARYQSTYGVGSLAVPKDDEELVSGIRESFLTDMGIVLNPWEGAPTLRSYVIELVKELGANLEDAFDIAEEFVKMHTWFSSLDLIEQNEIRAAIERNDD